ncbi:hypothetical protein DASC09_029460 [Saccharomycopsis crataegensis]|uniref:Uncharacterized protein n=1 Tax=Saccharomycopsis crataegensis TaxID=43959 RepID=A0AAV5QLQ2_9ASCO|nr:hypothetical protein DASC09_029460 [Saccharomycopsis crataegensis]
MSSPVKKLFLQTKDKFCGSDFYVSFTNANANSNSNSNSTTSDLSALNSGTTVIFPKLPVKLKCQVINQEIRSQLDPIFTVENYQIFEVERLLVNLRVYPDPNRLFTNWDPIFDIEDMMDITNILNHTMFNFIIESEKEIPLVLSYFCRKSHIKLVRKIENDAKHSRNISSILNNMTDRKIEYDIKHHSENYPNFNFFHHSEELNNF